MPDLRSRLRSRRKEEQTPVGVDGAGEAPAAKALNKRWTGYHPSLADAMNATRLSGLRQTQRKGVDDA